MGSRAALALALGLAPARADAPPERAGMDGDAPVAELRAEVWRAGLQVAEVPVNLRVAA